MSDANDASIAYAPVGGGSAPRAAQRLNGTGTTEDHASTALPKGAQAYLLVGDTAVRVSFRGETGASAQVATTDPILPANSQYRWTVTADTSVPYVEAADASSEYEAWVWQGSPGRV